MSNPSDHYHKWLGISPDEYPPNHYRLLGIADFESDQDVIRNAADQRMVFLRTIHHPEELAVAQELLNQVAKAKICLLSDEQKREYDTSIQDSAGSRSDQPVEAKLHITKSTLDNFSTRSRHTGYRRTTATSRRSRRTIAAGLTLGLFLAAAASLVLSTGRDNPAPPSVQTANPNLDGPTQPPLPEDPERHTEPAGAFQPFPSFDSVDELVRDLRFDTPQFNLSNLTATILQAGQQQAIENVNLVSHVTSISRQPNMLSSWRHENLRPTIVTEFGVTPETERSVNDGLEWLVRNQTNDGSWSMRGPYTDGATVEDRTAATAMAAWALVRSGHCFGDGRFGKDVQQAVRFLIRNQKSNGDLWKGTISHNRLYAHGIAMNLLCEVYDMQRTNRLRVASQRAVDYAVSIQDKKGGWRYEPGTDSDTSVTGWFTVALCSAANAGLKVPEETFVRISAYLDSVSSNKGTQFAYQPARAATHAQTAVGLLCRRLLSGSSDASSLRKGVRELSRQWPEKHDDVYYHYYASRCLFDSNRDIWTSWNKRLVQVTSSQTKNGSDRGSWSPKGDRFGAQGGRLYVTCFRIYSLQTAYSHPPSYLSTDDQLH